MSPVEVGRAERGVRDLRISTVFKLARGLGVPACELLRGLQLPSKRVQGTCLLGR
jgi:transcriptional regulator with XRE-family HTH domain